MWTAAQGGEVGPGPAEGSSGGATEPGRPSLDELAAAFLDLRRPLTPSAGRLALAIYDTLAGGRPATVAALAGRLGWPADEVERQLEAWTGVLRGAAGEVVGFWGLSISETPHRLEVGGVTVYTWCAWDPLFLVPLLGRAATLVTTCPVTAATIRLRLRPGARTKATPAGAALSFVVPRRECGDVRTDFCQHVHLFSDIEAARDWASVRPGGFALTLAEGAMLAATVNEQRYLTAG